MTLLEYILIGVIWVGYGAFASYQSRKLYDFDGSIAVIYVVVAPVLLLVKCIYGAVKEYN